MGLLTGSSRVGGRTMCAARAPAWLTAFTPTAGRRGELLGRVDAVREALTSDGRTLAQGALGWLWARSPRTVPIPGFRSVAQAEENAGAIAQGPLPAARMEEIEALLDRSPAR